ADISMADLRSLGEDIIAKEVEVQNRSQGLAVIGVMRLGATPEAVHQALATINQEMVGVEESSVKALNLIPQPAGEEEFAAFEFTKTEKKALESCELGSCRVKLTAALIDKVAELDYDWEDDADAFTGLYRAALSEYARGYQQSGNAALWTYGDKPEPLEVLDGFKRAVAESQTTVDILPEVVDYLFEYPGKNLEGAEDFFFWSVLDFGQRPTLTINHAVSYRPQYADLDHVFVIKNIYANHYFGGRLSVGVLLEEGAMGLPGRYYVLIDHLQFDGELNRFLRRMLSGGIVDDVENRMRLIRKVVLANQG
ncbi:MAG: hypothetical protein OES38_13905, partial [Gammaproteobacteria bacterium]|nr:hypothetical protein [Gammaproteobacteria bacterium]